MQSRDVLRVTAVMFSCVQTFRRQIRTDGVNRHHFRSPAVQTTFWKTCGTADHVLCTYLKNQCWAHCSFHFAVILVIVPLCLPPSTVQRACTCHQLRRVIVSCHSFGRESWTWVALPHLSGQFYFVYLINSSPLVSAARPRTRNQAGIFYMAAYVVVSRQKNICILKRNKVQFYLLYLDILYDAYNCGRKNTFPSENNSFSSWLLEA